MRSLVGSLIPMGDLLPEFEDWMNRKVLVQSNPGAHLSLGSPSHDWDGIKKNEGQEVIHEDLFLILRLILLL
jgi:hypothetical protein